MATASLKWCAEILMWAVFLASFERRRLGFERDLVIFGAKKKGRLERQIHSHA